MKELSDKYVIINSKETYETEYNKIQKYELILFTDFSQCDIVAINVNNLIESLSDNFKMFCTLSFNFKISGEYKTIFTTKVEIICNRDDFRSSFLLNIKPIFESYTENMYNLYHKENYIIYRKDQNNETVSIENLQGVVQTSTYDNGVIVIKIPINQLIKQYLKVIDKEDFLNEL